MEERIPVFLPPTPDQEAESPSRVKLGAHDFIVY